MCRWRLVWVLLGLTSNSRALIWAMWRRGDAIREMERTLGETLPRIRRYLRESGGIPPIPRRRRLGHLSLDEREEISRGIAAGLSARAIAGRINRPSSTVSREIARNGGRDAYRAVVADAAAFERARRPKPSKLAANAGATGCGRRQAGRRLVTAADRPVAAAGVSR